MYFRIYRIEVPRILKPVERRPKFSRNSCVFRNNLSTVRVEIKKLPGGLNAYWHILTILINNVHHLFGSKYDKCSRFRTHIGRKHI